MDAALAGAGRVLAVHTNKPGALARKILAGLDVAGRFVAIVGGDDAPRKPDPAGTLEIMARVGAPARTPCSSATAASTSRPRAPPASRSSPSPGGSSRATTSPPPVRPCSRRRPRSLVPHLR